MAKSPNPQATDPFANLQQAMEQFKLPGVDMGAIAESRRKDVQALLDANQATLQSMQELARKQLDIFTQAMQGAQERMGAMVASGGAPDLAKQNELARKAYEKAVAQMSELAEMARKAQADAMAGITRRAQESAEEIKRLLQPR